MDKNGIALMMSLCSLLTKKKFRKMATEDNRKMTHNLNTKNTEMHTYYFMRRKNQAINFKSCNKVKINSSNY